MLIYFISYGLFPYDGYSVTDRTAHWQSGTDAQYYHLILSPPPPHSPDVHHIFCFLYDGYSETNRTGTAQNYHLILWTPPPHPLMYIPV